MRSGKAYKELGMVQVGFHELHCKVLILLSQYWIFTESARGRFSLEVPMSVGMYVCDIAKHNFRVLWRLLVE